MDELIFFINKVIVSGTVIGSIYALGAVGVTLVFGILRFAHFAHGDMMTLGAFFTYSLVAILAAAGLSLPIPLGIALMPVAMALTSVAALGLDRGFYAPLRRRGAKPITLLIASIGVTLMLQGVIRLFYGTSTRTFFETEPKDIFRFDMHAGLDEFGRYQGTLQPTGIRPRFLEQLDDLGIKVPVETFLPQPTPAAPPPPTSPGRTRWDPANPDRSHA